MSCAVTAGPCPSAGKFTAEACVGAWCLLLSGPTFSLLASPFSSELDGSRAVRRVMKWAEVDQEKWSIPHELISPKSPGANSITFHFLLQPLSLVSGATW